MITCVRTTENPMPSFGPVFSRLMLRPIDKAITPVSPQEYLLSTYMELLLTPLLRRGC